MAKRRKGAGRRRPDPGRPTAATEVAGEATAARRRAPVAVAAALAAAMVALVVAAHHRVVLGGETFVERDALRLTLPSRTFLVDTLRQGRLPEWYDGVGFGTAFAANPVHETLTPLGWTMALLPTPIGFDLYDLLHVVLAGLGTAALARRLGASATGGLVAGASLALGGYVVSMIPNGLARSLSFAPWVAWAADRLAARLGERDGASWPAAMPPAALFAALLALQVMAGEPASLLVAALLAATVALLRDRHARRGTLRGAAATAGGLAAGGLAATLLAAVAVVPGVLLLAGSARAAGLDRGGVEWSLHPGRLVELVWPMAYGSQLADGWLAGLVLRDGPGDPFWSFSLFLGLPVLVAAAAAARERRVRRLLLSSAGFVLLAIGPATPLWGLLAAVLPPLAWVNFPEKLVYGALVLWCAAAGVGWGRLFGPTDDDAPHDRRRAVLRRTAIASGVATLLLALAVGTVALRRAPLTAELERRAAAWEVLVHVDRGIVAALAGGAVAVAAAALFTAALFIGALALAARGRYPVAGGLALVAVLGPLVWSAGRLTPTAPRALVAPPPAVLAGLPAPLPAAPRPRLVRVPPAEPSGPFLTGEAIARDYHESLETNVAARFGFAIVPGFEPAETARMRRLVVEIFPRMTTDAFLRLLGFDWIVAHEPAARGLPYPVAARGELGWAALDPGPTRPRAFVTPTWTAVADPDRALGALTDPRRAADPARIALTAETAGTPPGGPLVPCDVAAPRPEEVILDCDSPRGGWAVLLAEQVPGWTATVDGVTTEIALAEGVFRAVPVAPGPRRVVFRYRTPGLVAGAAVSAAAWLALAVAATVARRRCCEAQR